MKTLVCDCNHSMPLDFAALSGAIGEPLTPHSQLCRREIAQFQGAVRGAEPLLVACTQEARLFTAVAAQTSGVAPPDVRPMRFVNIRETAGWSRQAHAAGPKIAALLAAARLGEPEPVPTVSYSSQGHGLVIGDAESLSLAVSLLSNALRLTLLDTGAARGKERSGGLPLEREQVLHAGCVHAVRGWLGAFQVEWQSSNPIDLDICTRCSACVKVCPQGAIGWDYQIDLTRCTDQRDCVRACGAIGAINFERAPQSHIDTFDLVLDLQPRPAIHLHQVPQGYYAPGSDPLELARAVGELRDRVGTFEKPRFVHYEPKLCAHTRNGLLGCNACVDVCSAEAIASRARLRADQPPQPVNLVHPPREKTSRFLNQIEVEPHLCVGCGACTTVCPSGALAFEWPRPADMGARLKVLLSTARRAGLERPALLLHNQAQGAQLLGELGRLAAGNGDVLGVPAHVVPVALWHVASVGLDLWLAAVAWGAAEILVLASGEEAPAYLDILRSQLALGQTLLHGMGYAGTRLALMQTHDPLELDALLGASSPQGPVPEAVAGFAALAQKRATLELALDHLLRHAPMQAVGRGEQPIVLPHGAFSPFGSVRVDTARCTLCLSCVGACPEGALLDNLQAPQLSFIEKNCVQCGLCVKTCPEDAIRLEPRLLWGSQRGEPRSLHAAQPWRCIRCGAPFGTVQAIEQMLVKLAGHPAFSGAAAERLKMCGDCRVIDMHTAAGSTIDDHSH